MEQGASKQVFHVMKRVGVKRMKAKNGQYNPVRSISVFWYPKRFQAVALSLREVKRLWFDAG
jgi:hypothetical protein